MTSTTHPTHPTPHTPTHADTIRATLDAVSSTGAALGAVKCISREGFTPSQLAAWGAVERNLCAALGALDALASGLGLQLHRSPGAGGGE